MNLLKRFWASDGVSCYAGPLNDLTRMSWRQLKAGPDQTLLNQLDVVVRKLIGEPQP